MLQWTWGYRYRFKTIISFPSNIYLEVGGITGSYGSSIFNFLFFSPTWSLHFPFKFSVTQAKKFLLHFKLIWIRFSITCSWNDHNWHSYFHHKMHIDIYLNVFGTHFCSCQYCVHSCVNIKWLQFQCFILHVRKLYYSVPCFLTWISAPLSLH